MKTIKTLALSILCLGSVANSAAEFSLDSVQTAITSLTAGLTPRSAFGYAAVIGAACYLNNLWVNSRYIYKGMVAPVEGMASYNKKIAVGTILSTIAYFVTSKTSVEFMRSVLSGAIKHLDKVA